jgi:hypothetical protein
VLRLVGEKMRRDSAAPRRAGQAGGPERPVPRRACSPPARNAALTRSSPSAAGLIRHGHCELVFCVSEEQICNHVLARLRAADPRPAGTLVVSNTFERQQDACPLQGDEVRGGNHHLEVQHVLIEVPGAPRLHSPKLRAGTPATPPPWLRSWHSLGPTTPRLAKASSAQACAGGM